MDNINIVIINGSGGSGKSTFCNMCCDYAISKYNSIAHELSTVEWVKDVAKFCGWNGAKEEKDRAFLHAIKMALEDWNNSPNTTVTDKIAEYYYNTKKHLDYVNNFLFFVNIREKDSMDKFVAALAQKNLPEEIKLLKLLVINNNVPLVNGNDGDKNVFEINYDCVIKNNQGLEELRYQARRFVDDIFSEKF